MTGAADQKLTAEEELTRRFGNGWDGAKTPTADAAEPQPDLVTAATAALAASAKRREKRREITGTAYRKENRLHHLHHTTW